MKNILEGVTKFSLALISFLLPLFFLPFSTELYEFNKVFLLFFLILLGLLGWVGRLILVERALVFKKSPFDLWILLFLGVFILSSIFSQDWRNSVFGAYGRFSPSLVELSLWVAFYFLITQNLTMREGRNLITLFLLSSFFVALSFHLSFFGLMSTIPYINAVFISTLGVSPQALAMFLGVSLILLLTHWIFLRFPHHLSQIFYITVFVTNLVALVLINFQAVWFILAIFLTVLVVSTLYFCLLSGPDINRLALPVFLVLVSILFLLLPSLFQFRNLPVEILLNQETSWGISFDTFRRFPLFGIGPGNWQQAFLLFKPLSFNSSLVWAYRFDTPLSYYASLLATVGIGGIISYLLLIGMGIRSLSKIFLQEHLLGFKTVVLTPVLGLAALLAGSFFYYQSSSLSLLFWLLLGVIGLFLAKGLAVNELRKEFGLTPEANLFLTSLFLVIVLGVAALGAFAGRFYYADILYRRSLTLPTTPDKVALLNRVVSLNPFQIEYRLALAQSAFAYSLDQVGKIGPNNSEDLSQIAPYVSIALGESDFATRATPKRIQAWENKGLVLRDLRAVVGGELTNLAIDAFAKAAQLEPLNPAYQAQLARLFIDDGQLEKANQALKKAKELKGDYLPLNLAQALLKEKEGEPNEAMKLLEDTLTIPQLAPAFFEELSFNLGRIAYNSGDSYKAIEVLNTLVEDNPKHANALYLLGLSYEKVGDTSKALENYKKVLELNPANEEIQKRLKTLGG